MNRVYLIEQRDNERLPRSFHPLHDYVTAFVVIAETPLKARTMVANTTEGDERKGDWLDPKLTSCKRIGYTGRKPSIVLTAFAR
jgi:hypothetical protein